MSVRIFLDVEEALARQIRRVTHHDSRTQDKTILQETYDPFSGEVIKVPVEPEFYDSSADAGGVQYPHVFIKLQKAKEDKTSGREVPLYGNWLNEPVINSPKAYKIILDGNNGLIPTIGNEIVITTFQIRKVQVGNLIRLLNGNNKGTYIVDSIVINPSGDHTIIVSSTIVSSLPASYFNNTTRTVSFTVGVDLSTVKVGDLYTDSSSTTYNIVSVDVDKGFFEIDGSTTPSLASGALISRNGDVLTSTDLSPVRFLIMDQNSPIELATVCGSTEKTSQTVGVTPPVPLDAYYLVRIDSKTRENHIDILNRIWEEFNPPRTALPTIVRSKLSTDQLGIEDIPTGGSNIIKIKDTSKLSVGETIFIFDDLHPIMAPNGKEFERPLEAKVVDILSDTDLEVDITVPDTYKLETGWRIVSNADYRQFMFHFVDHNTKDIEGSQYWVHEFIFWVQFWVDRYEDPTLNTVGPITGIDPELEVQVSD